MLALLGCRGCAEITARAALLNTARDHGAASGGGLTMGCGVDAWGLASLASVLGAALPRTARAARRDLLLPSLRAVVWPLLPACRVAAAAPFCTVATPRTRCGGSGVRTAPAGVGRAVGTAVRRSESGAAAFCSGSASLEQSCPARRLLGSQSPPGLLGSGVGRALRSGARGCCPPWLRPRRCALSSSSPCLHSLVLASTPCSLPTGSSVTWAMRPRCSMECWTG
uniref:Uncharacterized protein n=1 Tax=Arundo donax TaxID=35708 RepID=A0A0A9BMJ7_ARUDO